MLQKSSQRKNSQLLLHQSFKTLKTFQVLLIKSECLKHLVLSYCKEGTACCAGYIGLLFCRPVHKLRHPQRIRHDNLFKVQTNRYMYVVRRDTAVSQQYENEVKLHVELILLCLKDKIILKGEHLDRTKGNYSILFWGKNIYIVLIMLKII